MLIVGIAPCKACKIFAASHPETRYVELPLRAEGNQEILRIKAALHKLKVNWFPVVLDDDLTMAYPPTVLEKR